MSHKNLEQRLRWAEREDRNQDPLEFFRENYQKAVDKALLKKLDSALYQALSKQGFLEQAISELENKSARSLFGYDPVVYYLKHHKGRTRGQLKKENTGLYERLRRDKMLDTVLKADMKQIMIQRSPFGEDPVAYYQQHHAGLTRGRLSKENPGLYERLRREGLLDVVPKYSLFGNDPLAYYQQHHAGLTRGQLAKERGGLYTRLRRGGLLENVPTIYKLKK